MDQFVKKPLENENCYFMDSVAYTEDHIAVQMLYIYNVPTQLTQSKLQAYFARYGKVLRLTIRSCFNEGPHFYNTGFVLYAEKTDAARALSSYYGEGVRMAAADSWHQPDADELPFHLPVCLPNTQTPPPAVMILNDDCLEHIMVYLTLKDQVHFARSCLRFRAVYQSATARLHKIMNLSQFADMTVWDMRDFFMLSGAHVQQLSGTIPEVHTKRFCHFLVTKCRNLQTMNVISRSNLPEPFLINLLTRMHKLESLGLNLLYLKQISRYYDCYRILSGIKSEAVRVPKFYANLQKLERFTLDTSDNVSDEDILQLFVGCPKLRYIGLKDRTWIGEKLALGIVSRVREEIAIKNMQRKLPVELITLSTLNLDELMKVRSIKLSKDIIQFKAIEE